MDSLMPILRKWTEPSRGHFVTKVAGINVCFGKIPFPYLSYIQMLSTLCASNGRCLLWPAEGIDYASFSLRGSKVFGDYHARLEVSFYAIGGSVYRSEMRRLCLVMSNIESLDEPVVSDIFDSDLWLGLWNADKEVWIPSDPVFDQKSQGDVTVEVINLLLKSNELVIKPCHDGNPIEFYHWSNLPPPIVHRCIEVAEDSICKEEWIREHRKCLVWNEEYLEWDCIGC